MRKVLIVITEEQARKLDGYGKCDIMQTACAVAQGESPVNVLRIPDVGDIRFIVTDEVSSGEMTGFAPETGPTPLKTATEHFSGTCSEEDEAPPDCETMYLPRKTLMKEREDLISRFAAELEKLPDNKENLFRWIGRTDLKEDRLANIEKRLDALEAGE